MTVAARTGLFADSQGFLKNSSSYNEMSSEDGWGRLLEAFEGIPWCSKFSESLDTSRTSPFEATMQKHRSNATFSRSILERKRLQLKDYSSSRFFFQRHCSICSLLCVLFSTKNGSSIAHLV